MIQPQNGYNQCYFALDGTFSEAKLTRSRPGQGQMLQAEAIFLTPRPKSRPKFWPGGQPEHHCMSANRTFIVLPLPSSVCLLGIFIICPLAG